ncbi:hypothetical protein HDV64DRAFT_250839 [Trichoderma sp. TUCIM 5745]
MVVGGGVFTARYCELHFCPSRVDGEFCGSIKKSTHEFCPKHSGKDSIQRPNDDQEIHRMPHDHSKSNRRSKYRHRTRVVAESGDEGDQLHQLRTPGKKQRGACTTSPWTPGFLAVVSPTATPLHDYCSDCSGTEESLSDIEMDTSTKDKSSRGRAAFSPNLRILIIFFILACVLVGVSKLQNVFQSDCTCSCKGRWFK